MFRRKYIEYWSFDHIIEYFENIIKFHSFLESMHPKYVMNSFEFPIMPYTCL